MHNLGQTMDTDGGKNLPRAKSKWNAKLAVILVAVGAALVVLLCGVVFGLKLHESASRYDNGIYIFVKIAQTTLLLSLLVGTQTCNKLTKFNAITCNP